MSSPRDRVIWFATARLRLAIYHLTVARRILVICEAPTRLLDRVGAFEDGLRGVESALEREGLVAPPSPLTRGAPSCPETAGPS